MKQDKPRGLFRKKKAKAAEEKAAFQQQLDKRIQEYRAVRDQIDPINVARIPAPTVAPKIDSTLRRPAAQKEERWDENEGLTFAQAFAKSRKAGEGMFKWKGKFYSTALADTTAPKKPDKEEPKPKTKPATTPSYRTPAIPGVTISTEEEAIWESGLDQKGKATPRPATPKAKTSGGVPFIPGVTVSTEDEAIWESGLDRPKTKPTPEAKKPVIRKSLREEILGPEPQVLPAPYDRSTDRSILPADVVEQVVKNSKNEKYKTFKGKYYVYSKENGHFYLFDNQHRMLDSTVAGRGKTIGDEINMSDTESLTPGPHAYTRAGSAVLTKDTGKLLEAKQLDEYGTPFYRMKYSDAIGDKEGLGVHGTYIPEKEMRERILNDKNKIDKLMSWGCINVDKDWLNNPYTKPETGDSIYVTREPARNRLNQK